MNPADDHADGLVIRLMTEYRIEPIDWIWEGWIARRKAGIYAGVEGDGKGYSTADIIARLSAGTTLPDGAHRPACRVLLLIAEDGISDTVKPRLARHGANMLNVLVVDAVRESGRKQMFSIGRHLDLLRPAILDRHIDLVVIDPLSSFLQRSNRNDEGEIRDLMTPLTQLAEETNTAILGIAHVNRPNGTNRRATQRILGSTAFGAVARLVWMVVPAGDADDETRRVLGVVKSNLGIKPPALEWSIPGQDEPILWHGTSTRDIHELLNGGPAKKTTTPERQDILDVLEKNPQGMKPEDVALVLDKNVSTTRNLLRKMLDAGDVTQPAYGIYGVHSRRFVDSVDSVGSSPNGSHQESTESTESTNLRHLQESLPDNLDHCACGAPLAADDDWACRSCREAKAQAWRR